MATYAIGDIQGCFEPLQRLLSEISFEPGRDRLWLAGDLVNRGPDSLEVLRWASGLGSSVVSVLGNHDLHLLAASCGIREPRGLDTLDRVLSARDREPLIDWLRKRPLLHRDGGYVLVHAGLHPSWSVDQAARLAREVERDLRAPDWETRLAAIYHRRTKAWKKQLAGTTRVRAAMSIFVSVRCVADDGGLCDFSGAPEDAPKGCRPWFDLRGGRDEPTLLFGHWAMLGHRVSASWICLDSGCVWGNALTAVRLEDREVFQVPA